MRVLWPHNFDPQVDNAGVFMFAAAEGLRTLGVDVQLEYLGNLRSPLNILKARRVIQARAKEFDLVHAQYGSACALATAGVTTRPKVVSLRGSDWNVRNSAKGFSALHSRLARLMTRHSLPKYDLAIAVSHRMKDDLRRHFKDIALAALPAPIDLDLFKPMEQRKAREALGFANNSERWILFNSLHFDNPVKRFGLAARAVELANEKMGNIRLRLANKIPHKEMPHFVASCDLILCTSESEGWPNSVKEALACNVPFVSTDVSDLHSIASFENSCKITSAEPAALADSICEALESKVRPDLRKYVLPMGMRETSETMLSMYVDLVQNWEG